MCDILVGAATSEITVWGNKHNIVTESSFVCEREGKKDNHEYVYTAARHMTWGQTVFCVWCWRHPLISVISSASLNTVTSLESAFCISCMTRGKNDFTLYV